MNTRHFRLLAGMALALGFSTAFADDLSVGDKAPPIKVQSWVQGKPVTSGPGGVRVVEFWATWCGPCKQSIPHLSELAKKYGDKVTFTGVDVFERSANDVKTVTDFVKQMGDKMTYNVAVDDKEGTMGKTWMNAAHQPGIPAAFILDQQGTVLWVGHPMAGLEQALDQVLAGKFDLEASKKEFATAAAQAIEQEKLSKAIQAAQKDYEAGKKSEAISALDKLAAKSDELRSHIKVVKFSLLYGDNRPEALKLTDAAAKSTNAEDAFFLVNAAMLASKPKDKTSKANYADAIKFAEDANGVMKGKDPYVLYLLGIVYDGTGEAAKAIAVTKQALDLFDKSDYKDSKDLKAEMQASLDKYQAKSKG